MVQDYMIHKFIKQRGGKATKQEIFEALGSDQESQRIIEERLLIMQRMGVVVIDEDEDIVTIK